MSLGKRIKKLRQQKGLSQAKLAEKLGMHQKQISVYERDVHIPSTEQLVRLAKAFKVSLDYLVLEKETNHSQLSDVELLEKLQEMDLLPDKDRSTLKHVLDTFILKHKFQKLVVD